MKRRPSARSSVAPVATVWLSPKRNAINLLAEVECHARHGRRVHVMRAGGDRFEVLLNGMRYMVRTLDGDPVGTFSDLRAAIAAGDLSLDDFDPNEYSDDDPGSAA